MTKIDVKKIAKLANLPLSGEEEKLYQTQLEKILSYVDQIEKKVKDIKAQAIFNVSQTINVQAEDEIANSLSQAESLKNSKRNKRGYFVTKGVFADE